MMTLFYLHVHLLTEKDWQQERERERKERDAQEGMKKKRGGEKKGELYK